VSTNRAVVMYSIMLLANLIGKTFDLLSALSLSAFIILLQNPMQILSAGFLLSFGAVLGIALIMPGLKRLYKGKTPVLSGIYVSLSAQLFTLPVILYFYFQIPMYSVLINILVVPLSSLLVFTSLAAGIVSFISLPLGIFIAGGANYILLFYEQICRFGSKLPGNLITIGRPDMIRIILYYLLILFFIWGAGKSGRKSLPVLIAAIVILIYPNTNKGFTATMLDVGQGEAIYMETEERTTFLIDGGSCDIENVGTYRIQPFLLSRGVDRIDYGVVTHADTDHISGLTELIADSKITISNLILPKIDKVTDNYRKLEAVAKKNGINILYIRAGDYIREGKLNITCLHPYEGYNYSSENSYSTVLSVKYGEFDMLLTGDLEAEGEDLLISKLTEGSLGGANLYKYDVLKVAHHGSKYSSSMEFLSIIRPNISIISCGYGNKYGHPHQELIERLKIIESRTEITYKTGAITVWTDGEIIRVERYMESRGIKHRRCTDKTDL